MREVHIQLESENGVPTRAMSDAIGYLSTWAITMYDQVNIYPEKLVSNPDMIAVFTQSEGNGKYVIGAIFDQDTNRYSFHS